jgi:lipid II:glycine glycyltransferase (peptidoglycan interpeptide bridge formation enzyme)
MQSLYWAQVKKLQGLPCIHFGLFQADELIGGSIFYTSKKRNGAGLLIAPEGPVLPWENELVVEQSLRLIIDKVQTYASDLGIMAMRIEPRLVPPLMSALREFGRAPVDLVPQETLYIDLSPSEQSLLSRMKHKGRYNIKLSQGQKISVREDNTVAAVNRFYSIMQEASARNDFPLEPKSFFQHLAEVMCPAGHAKFFFSEHEEDTLGTLLLITYGARSTYLYGGITNLKRNLMGGYALQWEALQAAKDSGSNVYDFYGFDQFRSPENQYSRFSQFKNQFGGEVVRFIGAHDFYFLDNLADAFIKVINESGAYTGDKNANLIGAVR